MKQAVDMCKGLRYKLRMMGVPVEGLTTVFCDNEAAHKNSTFAESALNKKRNSICFHRVREAVAAGILCAHKVESGSNLADVLTKLLPGPKRKELRSHDAHVED